MYHIATHERAILAHPGPWAPGHAIQRGHGQGLSWKVQALGASGEVENNPESLCPACNITQYIYIYI